MTLNNRISQVGSLAFVFGNILFIANKLDEMSRLFLSRPMPDVISGQNPLLLGLGLALGLEKPVQLEVVR